MQCVGICVAFWPPCRMPVSYTHLGYAGGLPHPAVIDYSYDGAMRSFEQSLLRLGADHIDILLIHDVDIWTHGDRMEQRFTEAMDGAYRALEKLLSLIHI